MNNTSGKVITVNANMVNASPTTNNILSMVGSMVSNKCLLYFLEGTNNYRNDKFYMSSCATPVIHVWCFRCIPHVQIQVYYMCRRYMSNTHILLM